MKRTWMLIVVLIGCTSPGSVADDGGELDAGMDPDAAMDTAPIDSGSVDGGSDAGVDAASDPCPTADCPLALRGFVIRDTEPARIYFESNVAFTGSVVAGFLVPSDLSSNTPSGEAHFHNSLTAVSVNPGSTTGHYFSLEHAYVYGDNVLIKYDGGGDFIAGDALAPFTHERVDNQIAEPSYDGRVYYVDRATGDDDDDGLTEAQAFQTIRHAARIAEAGDTVYIKAGNYGAEHVVFANSGRPNARIRYEGYRATPGDIANVEWSYGSSSVDAAVMPLLDGSDRDSGFGLDLFANQNDYITIANLQLTNYAEAVRGRNNQYLVMRNVVAANMGRVGYSGHGFTFIGIAYNNTFDNCVVENATATAYRIYGFFNSLTNSHAYCDEFDGDAGGSQEPTDYYTTLRGDWNYLAGLHLEKVGDLEHGGHGITFKGDRDLGFAIGSVANNLAENSTVVHINGSVELRHRMVQHNTIRNIHAHANLAFGLGRTGGFDLRDGASNNIIEDSLVEGVKNGISFFDGSEDQGAHYLARNNIIRNTVFSNVSQSFIRMDRFNAPTDDLTDNQVLYCTFHNSRMLFAGLPQGDLSGNRFVGNIVSGVEILGQGVAAFEQSYNNYFTDFAMPAGEGNISADPLFVDPSAGDFHLADGSPCLDAGMAEDDVTRDADGTPRPRGSGYDLGAFEREGGVDGVD